MVKRYKVVLVGPSGMGKTTFVKRHLTGEFDPHTEPSIGVAVHPLWFQPDGEDIKEETCFDVWDIAGDPELRAPLKEYLIAANAAIIMYDGAGDTYPVIQLLKEIQRECGPLPIVYCASKTDTYPPDGKCWFSIGYDGYKLGRKTWGNYDLLHLNSLTGDNLDEPFKWIARWIERPEDYLDSLVCP